MATAPSKESTTPAEWLRAAADLLGTRFDEGTSGPWTLRDPDPWGDEVEVRGPSDILVARTTRADGYLLLNLHAIAPLLVKRLQDVAKLCAETSEIHADGSVWHHTEWCDQRLAEPDGGPVKAPWYPCRCFEDDLALADAILGGAS